MSVVSGTIDSVVKGGRTSEGSRAEHLVGRADQRSRLRSLLDEVISDGSRFVILSGDGGAGKTTIIEAFAADLFSQLADPKAQLTRGLCVPMADEALPYAPMVGTFRDLVAKHGREQVLAWAAAGRPALGVLLP